MSNGFAKIRSAIWFIFIEFTILDSITLLLNWNALYISILFFTLEFFISITSFRTVFFILSQLSRIENIIQIKRLVKPKLDLVYIVPYLQWQIFHYHKLQIAKGQLISKAKCQAVDSPKERTNEFAFFDLKSCYLVKSNALCLVFLEKLRLDNLISKLSDL